MSHTIFLLGAVIVTCFLPEKVFCYEYNGVTYLKKDVLHEGTDGLVITVDVKLQTIDEPIKGPHDKDDFNALCMPISNTTIAKSSMTPDDVKFGGLGGDTNMKSGIGFLTCFVPKSTFGFHVVRRLYYIMEKVQSVYHNGGKIVAKPFQFPKGDGEEPELGNGAKIFVETYSPYLKFDVNYLQFKGKYRSLGTSKTKGQVVGVREIPQDFEI